MRGGRGVWRMAVTRGIGSHLRLCRETGADGMPLIGGEVVANMGNDSGRRGVVSSRLRERCRRFNAAHALQVAAGKARAAEFTLAHQARFGHVSFSAFSARWRAEQGMAPLSAGDVRGTSVPR